MTVQNEVAWLIDTIQTEWPTTGSLGGANPPDDLAFVNRDEPMTFYPDGDASTGYSEVRELGAATDNLRSVGVSSGGSSRSFYGNKPQYQVETTVDVRVEEKTVYEHGAGESVAEHDTLVAFVQTAINSQLSYPSVDPDAEDIGRIQYEDLLIEDENDLSVQDKDYYRTDFTVRLRGKQDTP